MWEKIRRQFDPRNRRGEVYYATHHHLVPLYVLLGLCIVAILFMACYISVLWKNVDRDAWLNTARVAIDANSNLYLPATINPTDKKQYVYSANVRFPVTDPYNSIRYAFDPGVAGTATSSTVVITTEETLQEYTRPLINSPEEQAVLIPSLQQCSKLFVIRFEPGVVPFGGFAPLQEFRLRDGRTAYIHKNATCVPNTTASMNRLDKVEQTVLSLESY